MAELTETEVRTIIGRAWRVRCAWFLGSFAFMFGLWEIGHQSTGPAADIAYSLGSVGGLGALIFGGALWSMREEAALAMDDLLRYRDDPDGFRRRHWQLYYLRKSSFERVYGPRES